MTREDELRKPRHAMTAPYLQYKDYLKERYGEPLFRVPIDFDLDCPHRESDGTDGRVNASVRGQWMLFGRGRERWRRTKDDLLVPAPPG